MIKKLFLLLVATLSLSALGVTAKTPKSVLEKSLSQISDRGISIKNRKTTANTDSFELVVSDFDKLINLPNDEMLDIKPTDPQSAGTVKSTKSSKAKSSELNGITMQVDVNYQKDAYHSTIYLSKFPTKELSKDEKVVIERMIKNQLLFISSDFNITTNRYTMDFKDIDETFDTIKVKTDAIKANGVYDIDHLDSQSIKFNLGTLSLSPTEKKFLGEYLNISNLYINVASIPNGKMLDMSYNIGVELIDANISKSITKVNRANVDIKVGNLNRDAYNKLVELGQSKSAIDPNSPEIMNLATNLLTQELYIEIKDLSIDDLIAEGQKMGAFKATAKVSLKQDPNVAELIKVNPIMALSALEVEANIELSQEMLKALSQTPKGAMLAFIPPKMEKGVAKYAIKYSGGQLLVNGKPLQ
ncbi:MAG: DUF945 family protein [Campylobacterota bacterium]|nr:DUF945 family protein [Campylobacterota bacterium]